MNATTSNGNGNGKVETSSPLTKEPNKAKLEKLFAEYAKLDDKLAAVEKAIQDVRDERSVLVKAIHDEGGKGPYTYKGDRYNVVARVGRFFFRGESTVKAIDVG